MRRPRRRSAMYTSSTRNVSSSTSRKLIRRAKSSWRTRSRTSQSKSKGRSLNYLRGRGPLESPLMLILYHWLTKSKMTECLRSSLRNKAFTYQGMTITNYHLRVRISPLRHLQPRICTWTLKRRITLEDIQTFITGHPSRSSSNWIKSWTRRKIRLLSGSRYKISRNSWKNPMSKPSTRQKESKRSEWWGAWVLP